MFTQGKRGKGQVTLLEFTEIERAAEYLQGKIYRTPLLFSELFSKIFQANVYLKLENMQIAGSFKARGALYKIAQCRRRISAKGVVAASAGNHAQGVALAAQRQELPCTIVMPQNASIGKQLATKSYGARIILEGRNLAESLETASRLEQEGYFFIHPFDDAHIIAGQGTIGLEILHQLPEVEEVWVPVGGGGLISGVALALKSKKPSVHIVGVEAKHCPSASEALRQNRPVKVEPKQTVADGIAVPRVGELNFPLLRRYVDRILTVGEDQIYMAMVELMEKKKILAEGSGAAPLAALFSAPKEELRGKNIVLLISGGNVDLSLVGRILEKGLLLSGRIMRIRVIIDDVPGSLVSLLHLLSGLQGNILHIFHDRIGLEVPVGRTGVEIQLETLSDSHAQDILEALEKNGFKVEAKIP
ncbi:MAG: threonine ammonia-lyase [Planctomycetota bacterium]|nr:MAG: threonine ammonia-lyase [Planctomycetota bacterium]